MEKKLRMARINFDYACYKKLEAKEKEGWTGWDNPDNKKLLKAKLMKHIIKPLTQDNLVDIANFCNFLWNLIEVKKRR